MALPYVLAHCLLPMSFPSQKTRLKGPPLGSWLGGTGAHPSAWATPGQSTLYQLLLEIGRFAGLPCAATGRIVRKGAPKGRPMTRRCVMTEPDPIPLKHQGVADGIPSSQVIV